MKKRTLFAGGFAVTLVTAIAIGNTAFAWHPQGAIVKKVQNVTSNGALSDANTAQNGISAKPGDTLKYVIEVRNDGTPDQRGYNDMAKTVLTDTLPAGVELVGNPAQRTITADLGTIKPGQKVVKEYSVKVTADKDGAIADNKACFTGNSTANDNPQQGCDHAVVTVSVPKVPETPKPETPKTPDTPQVLGGTGELPNTGSGNIAVMAAAAVVLGYASRLFIFKKQEN